MRILKIALLVIVIILGIGFYLKKKWNVNPPVKIFSHKYDGDLPLNSLRLPEGFKIEVYAEGVANARSMCFGSSNGVLFVGTRSEGNVYALVDHDMDLHADTIYTLLTKGNMPNGVAYKDGDLYVAEVNRVLRFKDIESHLDNPGTPEVVYDGYPTEKHHGWKYIAFGPDDKLYIPVGAPCNICESEDSIFNSITRLDLSNNQVEVVQRGVRNTVGFDWHPVTGDLWFTDNGRDMMGDDMPHCELNHAPRDGMHYGYPYCHQGDAPDPEFGDKYPCADFTKPAAKLGPHTAPLGIEIYGRDQFPSDYKYSMLIARHGSWNRSTKIGYDIYRVEADSTGKVTDESVFIEGWLSQDKKDVWGRPVDIETCDDGSILISDDFADAIYRVYYQPQGL